MKKIFIFCLMGCLLAASLTGCGKKAPDPIPYIKAIYNLYILGDTKEAEELGLSTEQITTARETYKQALSDNLRENFKTSGLDVSNEDIDAIVEARADAMSRMSAAYVSTQTSKTTAEVTIMVSYFDEVALDTAAAEDALAAADDEVFASTEEHKAFVTKTYIANLISAYKTLSPSVECKNIVVSCVLADGHWYPENADQFYGELALTICGQ